MDDLDKIIADRLDELLGKKGLNLRREDVARGMTALGFPWTANRVTQVVRGHRAMSVLEVAGICAVLRLPLAEIMGDEALVNIEKVGPTTVSTLNVWKALMGLSGWPAAESA